MRITTITLPEGGCINIGDYTVTLTGEKPYYYQSGEKTFTINAKTLAASNIADIAAQTYTGSALEPAVTVTDGEKTLVEGTDYTITYSDNTNIGIGKVTVKGKGNYGGEVVKEFIINPVTATDDISINSNVKIWSFEKTIFVENASKEIVIVDMAGRIVKTIKPENSRIEIQLSNSGVYIVKTGIKTQKVSL
ncbi:MAG: T9SS type A sorting domain-containing protein [Bacteroidales bacterium]|nr:T9SS type A sorting domain-containing protein [Bacteroidales bacterium]